MNNTCTLKVELEGLDEAERRVAALHAQWTEIAAMAREHKDIAVMTAQVARLDLVPGETLVVNVPVRITMEQRIAIQRMLRMDFGPSQRVLVLDGGATLSTLACAAGEVPDAAAT